jgi:outer membrane lipoprotein-sorting protein
MKKVATITIIIIFAVLISGCAQNKEIKEITISGHQEIYTFSNDIRESLKVHANDPVGIMELFLRNDRFDIVFDGSSGKDNAYFTVVVTNLNKIPIFYTYEHRIFAFNNTYYYIGEQWYDSTGGNITRPTLDKPTIWLKGPDTGANNTSLTLDGNMIYLQGTDYKNLTLAGDKLTLIVFGIDRID